MLGICKAIGNIDAATAPAFNADLHDTIDGSDEAFVSVDCSDVTFMDPAGYHVLIDATQYAARRGHTLVIRNMSPPCARLLHLYDWDRELRIEGSPQSDRNAASFSAASRNDLSQGLIRTSSW
jgi:anti-anti-sigma factor